jgi:hypothetical protein
MYTLVDYTGRESVVYHSVTAQPETCTGILKTKRINNSSRMGGIQSKTRRKLAVSTRQNLMKEIKISPHPFAYCLEAFSVCAFHYQPPQ